MHKEEETPSVAALEPPRFAYADAFSRNIGWFTESEQDRLRRSRVAIAGLGGVGGAHVLSLSRLGVGAFHIADFDRFELHNFNRQTGAFVSTIGSSKVDVMRAMALDINPECDVRAFPDGVSPALVKEFLQGVDLYVDGLDFFAIDIRRQIFAACAEMGIPALTAAPLGMGAAMLYFKPGGMTFEQYFRLGNAGREEMLARFLVGLSPTLPHRVYLADPLRVDFVGGRVPSTVIGCDLCAGMAAAAATQVLLGRHQPRPAPWSTHFDAFRRQSRSIWRPFGNANPIQRLVLHFVRSSLRLPPDGAGRGK